MDLPKSPFDLEIKLEPVCGLQNILLVPLVARGVFPAPEPSNFEHFKKKF